MGDQAKIARLIAKGLLAQCDVRSLEGFYTAPKRAEAGYWRTGTEARRADVEAGAVTLIEWHGAIEVQRLARYIVKELAKT